MTATVHQLPGLAGPPASLNLTPAEVQEAAGGYVRPSDQLRVLRDRGFTRAYISTVGAKRVVLERAHYDAVVRGQFDALALNFAYALCGPAGGAQPTLSRPRNQIK